MKQSVMILGGYGNFGKRISLALAKTTIPIIIVGRSLERAIACTSHIKTIVPQSDISVATFDIHQELAKQLQHYQPTIVINTCGPFQGTDHSLVKTCILHHVHYIDLADGRDFVAGITELDEIAKMHNVTVIAGASSVPGLSSAVIEHFKSSFSKIISLKYGISTAQKTARGLATASSILSYLGRPLKPFRGNTKIVYGWQDLYCQNYPVLGRRWMANCDIPDLDLIPEHYGIQSIQFSAGVESTMMHFCMWLVSWCIRLGMPIDLNRHVQSIQFISRIFNVFCKNKSGMHVILEGLDNQQKPKKIQWFIIANAGEGLEIPTIPAIILTQKILSGEFHAKGAEPCVGLVTLAEYLAMLKEYDIQTFVN